MYSTRCRVRASLVSISAEFSDNPLCYSVFDETIAVEGTVGISTYVTASVSTGVLIIEMERERKKRKKKQKKGTVLRR